MDNTVWTMRNVHDNVKPADHAANPDLHDNVNVTLGAEQQHWLTTYSSIDLAHWRWIALGLLREKRWVYVGCDACVPAVWAYVKRQGLLDANEFHYWPNSSRDEGEGEKVI